MNVLVYLIPAALLFGVASLVAFLWALRSGQYEDLDGAGERILIDGDFPATLGRGGPPGGNPLAPRSDGSVRDARAE